MNQKQDLSQSVDGGRLLILELCEKRILAAYPRGLEATLSCGLLSILNICLAGV
jgi:hypothetical protein